MKRRGPKPGPVTAALQALQPGESYLCPPELENGGLPTLCKRHLGTGNFQCKRTKDGILITRKPTESAGQITE